MDQHAIAAVDERVAAVDERVAAVDERVAAAGESSETDRGRGRPM